MNRSSIEVGREYAIREPKSATAELERVRVLEHVRADKWRVEWIDPNSGLVDFVRSKAILCRWGERRAVLRDEERLLEVGKVAAAAWPGSGQPLDDAVTCVLEATGESLWLHKGVLSGSPDALGRLANRSGLEIGVRDGSFIDRNGEWHGPWSTALDLARAFAAAEPGTVLLRIEVDQREWEVEAREPGRSHLLSLLEHYRAVWAVVRQWAGLEADLSRLNAEINRLRELINRTTWDLRRPGCDPERIAARLDRGLRGQ